MIQIYESVQKNDYETARKLHFMLSPLFRVLFVESNPVPVKKAVEMKGMAAGPVRLPLDDASAATQEKLREVLSYYD